MEYLTQQQIAAISPDSYDKDALGSARKEMQRQGLWTNQQQLGRRWPVACVALEITQRCNLDCTLCYLSEYSEATKDLPLIEVFRRIDQIFNYYGEGTDVQITGGDPTMRDEEELLQIVSRVAQLGMRPTLMTNGIKATRRLLKRLVDAGLMDIAFHVDTTQEIKGYNSEKDLNKLREKYLYRARGLPLAIMFNTTLHPGNFHEVSDLISFFASHAKQIRTVSFQLQAETGRGTEDNQSDQLTIENTLARINQGAGSQLNYDALQVGHPKCNRYSLCVAVDGRLVPLQDDPELFGQLFTDSTELEWQRNAPAKTALNFFRWLAKHPKYIFSLSRWAIKKSWELKRDLWRAKGQMTTMSIVVHNFMDACKLEPDRIDACVFKTMTASGPISMCVHNAKRDEYILQPIDLSDNQQGYWQPLTGDITTVAKPIQVIPAHQLPSRHLRGTARARQTAGNVSRLAG